MKIKVLIENKTYRPGIIAEHGLSLLIESKGKLILFDAGQTEALIPNSKQMKSDLSKVDFAVVSHGHFDHTGGFPAFCQLNHTAPVYIQKNAFSDFYDIKEDGSPEERPCGILWNNAQMNTMKNRLIHTDGPLWVDRNTVISGTIPHSSMNDATEEFLVKQKDGSYLKDIMDHEQFLAIEEDGNLYLFSGCSHTGIVNAIEYACSLFPGRNLKLLAAGMHMFRCSSFERNRIIGRMTELQIEAIIPMHCTGMEATCEMKSIFGYRCLILNAGDQISF